MKNWQTWLHGLAAAFIGATAGSVGAMLAAPAQFNLTSLAGLRNMAIASGGSGMVAAAAYLKQSPLPQPDTLERQSKTVAPDGTTTTTQTTATIAPKESQ